MPQRGVRPGDRSRRARASRRGRHGSERTTDVGRRTMTTRGFGTTRVNWRPHAATRVIGRRTVAGEREQADVGDTRVEGTTDVGRGTMTTRGFGTTRVNWRPHAATRVVGRRTGAGE